MSRLALRAALALLVAASALSAQQQVVLDLSPFEPFAVVGEVLGATTAQGEIVDARLDVTYVSNDTGAWSVGASYVLPTGGVGFSSTFLGWSGTGSFTTSIETDALNGLLVPPSGQAFTTWFLTWSSSVPFTLPGGGTGVAPADGFFETLSLTLTFAPCPFGDPSAPWTDLGGALSGASGTGTLVGEASLCPDEAGALSLTGAAPSSLTTLVVGSAALDAPFKGGVLVPSPDLLVPLVTDAAGDQTLPFTWPTAIPSGTKLFFQHWYLDVGTPAGLAASNALNATVP